jgi:hypothetical protein
MSEPVTLYVTPYPDKRGHDTYTTDEGRIPSQHIDKARYRAIPAKEFDAIMAFYETARRVCESYDDYDDPKWNEHRMDVMQGAYDAMIASTPGLGDKA